MDRLAVEARNEHILKRYNIRHGISHSLLQLNQNQIQHSEKKGDPKAPLPQNSLTIQKSLPVSPVLPMQNKVNIPTKPINPSPAIVNPAITTPAISNPNRVGQ
jgi:hypothetical protein